ncbi:MAG: hypothetical protein IK083_08525 [Abditibacteriota bacterium]|nr:hypothetical protein [Abditibacteriota bacterium]
MDEMNEMTPQEAAVEETAEPQAPEIEKDANGIMVLMYDEEQRRVDNVYDDGELNASNVLILVKNSRYHIDGLLENRGSDILRNVTIVWNIYYKLRGQLYLAENIYNKIDFMLPGDVWRFRTEEFVSSAGANPIACKLVTVLRDK